MNAGPIVCFVLSVALFFMGVKNILDAAIRGMPIEDLVGYGVGSMLPSFVLLIVGLVLVRQPARKPAVDVVQADPDWTGGISELVKICALSSAFEVPVIAHGHSLLPALHVAAAQSPQTMPMVEYLVRYQEHKQFFHAPIYRPAGGAVSLPELPGLGLVLDEAKIDGREEL